ncbi:MAG: hypothetical protein NTX50_11405 [Candidatus Sumerlaeota bacterium]|nr:hypothetical protein [Candidatus Sumerlaeota bacterium]
MDKKITLQEESSNKRILRTERNKKKTAKAFKEQLSRIRDIVHQNRDAFNAPYRNPKSVEDKLFTEMFYDDLRESIGGAALPEIPDAWMKVLRIANGFKAEIRGREVEYWITGRYGNFA